MKPVVALTFANNPDNLLPLLKQESRSIYDTLFPLHSAGAIELYREELLDMEEIIRIFDRFEDRIYIFHYGGHGGSEELFLGDRSIPREKFSALLRAQKNKARLVFLNGASSVSMVNSLLDAGVMAVIAADGQLEDTMASKFAGLFYQALSLGESIERSFEYARDELAPPKVDLGPELMRSLTFIVPEESFPFSLYFKDNEEDLLNWKLPMPTTDYTETKPTLVLHYSETQRYANNEESRKLKGVLASLHDNYGIELYHERNVFPEDILQTFERFKQQVFLYHFSGLEEWPILKYLRQDSKYGLEWLKNVKVFFLDGLGSLSQIQALLEMGIKAIIYTGKLPDMETASIKFAAWLYEFLKEGETLQSAFNKAAQNIWIFTDFPEPPSIMEYTSGKAESFLDLKGALKWGLYIKPGGPDILDWVLPVPSTRGVSFDGDFQDATPTGKNYLLTIGIDKYRNGIRPLNNAVKDAKKFRNILLENYRFEKPNAYSLFNQRASRKNILKLFDELWEKVTPEDNVVLFFSGHGIIHKPTNRGYWLPANSKQNDRSTYLSNSDVLDFIKSLRARHVFGIVDSCFSASLFAQRSLDQATERQYSIPSRWLLTAGRIEPVSDGSLGDHSPFANCLFARLEANKNSVLWTEELCLYLAQNLKFNAKKQLPRGEPLQNVGHQGGQFVFMAKEADMNDVWESENEFQEKREEKDDIMD